jgi:hypothetical protein
MSVKFLKFRLKEGGAYGKKDFEKDIEEISKEAFKEEGFKKDFEKTVQKVSKEAFEKSFEETCKETRK